MRGEGFHTSLQRDTHESAFQADHAPAPGAYQRIYSEANPKGGLPC
jgi:hypothetical protein